MGIDEVIKKLVYQNIIDYESMDYEQLNGGTVSEVYLLNADGINYVVKFNEPTIIASESKFLAFYKELTLLPDLLFVNTSNKYIVYSFINGSTNYDRKNKKEVLKTLVQGLLNQYKPAPNNIGWGWADQPTDSWQSFLMNEVMEANRIIGSRLDSDDYNLVLNLVRKISPNRNPFLLHGDCGVHNFIFKNGQFCGVIDPTPVIGDSTYDLIYAFCSSPDDLTKEVIDSAASQLKSEKNKSSLYEEVVICLYVRIRTCIKHHPEDYSEYLQAWYYWKDIIKNGSQ